MKTLVSKSYKILFAFGIAIISFSLVNWYNILSLIASKEYLDHTKYAYNSLDSFNIVIFVFLFCFISSIFTYILIANNEQGRLLKLNFYLTIFNIIWNIILIPKFSFIWSSIATLLSQVIMLINTYIASRHIFKFNFMPWYTLMILFLGISAWVFNYYVWLFFHFWVFVNLIVSAIIFWIIYIPGSYFVFKRSY